MHRRCRSPPPPLMEVLARQGRALPLSLSSSMAEALKLATSQGCRTTTHGGSISRLFSSQPVAPLSGIVGCRGNGYGGDLAVGLGL
jgi:hypothetical protein